jgi:GNAT superfamily N-acetyltransferase
MLSGARVEIREEPADGPASRALWEEYMALVSARLGEEFEPTEAIFATEDAFAGAGAAWLVLYQDGRPVACGGLRPLAPGVAEIKRMFVTARARGRGHGRRLLHELERHAADGGAARVRLLTTAALSEARALYRAEGYEIAERTVEDGREDYWLEKDLTGSSP